MSPSSSSAFSAGGLGGFFGLSLSCFGGSRFPPFPPMSFPWCRFLDLPAFASPAGQVHRNPPDLARHISAARSNFRVESACPSADIDSNGAITWSQNEEASSYD